MAENVGSIYYTVEADTSSLVNGANAADRSLDSMQGSMQRTDATAGKLQTRMTRVAGAVRQANQQIGAQTSAYSGLTRVVAAYLSLRTLQSVIELSDQYGQMASRIRNATSSAEEYAMVQERLLQTANGTFRALSEAQEVYLATADTLRDLGYTTSDVLDITDSFSYALVRDAARADQATTAMDAWSKALMKNKVEADGWASIMAATPSIVEGIAEATGRTQAEIRQLGASGKLSVEALNEGLRRTRDENKALADEMETSVADSFTKLRNSMTVFIGKVNESSGASQILTSNIAELADALQDPETIRAAQELAAGVVGALNQIIAGAKETVRIVKWAAEGIAAALHGAASDDIVRLEDQLNTYQEMLANPLKRLRIGGKGQAIALFSEDEIKANIAATQALIDQFYKDQEKKPPVVVPNVAPPSTQGKSGGKTGTVNAEAAATTGTKKLTEAQKAAKKAAQELAQAQKENIDTIASLGQQLALVGLKGKELMQTQAELQLNEYATPEQVAQVRALAAALCEAQQIEANKQLLGQMDPIAGEDQRYQTELENLKKLNEAKLLEDQRYLELKAQAEQQHDATMKQLEEERFRRQAAGNEMIMATLDQVQQAGTNALTGLITGANNGADAMRQLAGAMLNQVVGALVKVGIEQAKNFIMGQAQQAAAATTAAATGAAMASAYAPAAAAASVASFGGAATAGLTAMAAAIPAMLGMFAGGRQYGGPVGAGGMYRINENGAPEVFQAANGRQYMLPNTRGEVISNGDASAQGSPQISLQIINNGPPVSATAAMDGNNLRVTLDAVEQDFANKVSSGQGLYPKAIEGAYGFKRAGR
ncbi:tape measure protein [Pseudomonas aeruginosa]|uniref:Tape measure domain-containing protein n=1 Tax=Pseudomonas aeruginosa TaxID=287 RepID=A0A241XRR6_PSEAI|nr:tape measure protein [Pseudomonas aeruginosa]OTI35861.1 tape measure domain-containing protein [Pseudomonas aeruginosa]OTI46715.1 tape measure domain-containing protein [Pseudomonas aeruginosa]OTI61932.1 tape measure domain-containing protein [Pseudomonas aeruginosa]RPL82979.1 tape measure domain-containing protein [Pseudomonas aeruginosa]RPM09252.1 tape measure domain-containing protein [Pseudomonas aeruginosa]